MKSVFYDPFRERTLIMNAIFGPFLTPPPHLYFDYNWPTPIMMYELIFWPPLPFQMIMWVLILELFESFIECLFYVF